jgi:hypothetical protein
MTYKNMFYSQDLDEAGATTEAEAEYFFNLYLEMLDTFAD